MKEEITKKDLVPDTLSKIKLLGDRVLIKLDNAEDHTTTSSGLIVPLNDIVETDGGRLKTETSKRKHLTSGTILLIGEQSAAKLKEAGTELVVGDKVYVTEMVGKNVSSYQFFVDRTKLVQDFSGLVCIPHILIEAKIED
jgi:co-chaperonin GroES (HSP10)